MREFLQALQFSALPKVEATPTQASIIDKIVSAYYTKETPQQPGPADLVSQLMKSDARILSEIETLQSTLSVAVARIRELEIQNSELMKRVLQLQTSTTGKSAGDLCDSYAVTEDLLTASIAPSPAVNLPVEAST